LITEFFFFFKKKGLSTSSKDPTALNYISLLDISRSDVFVWTNIFIPPPPPPPVQQPQPTPSATSSSNNNFDGRNIKLFRWYIIMICLSQFFMYKV
jgi:hypothetical protein